MRFCPSCDVRLKKGTCPKCGHVESEVASASSKTSATEYEVNKSFNVLDGNEGKETLPTIKITCERCGHDEAVWWMLQTRSADEATTQFYRCIKCEHTWRNYD